MNDQFIAFRIKERPACEKLQQIHEVARGEGNMAFGGAFADILEDKEGGFIRFSKNERRVLRDGIKQSRLTLVDDGAMDRDLALGCAVHPGGIQFNVQACGKGSQRAVRGPLQVRGFINGREP